PRGRSLRRSRTSQYAVFSSLRKHSLLTTYVSLLVLIPFAALIGNAFSDGISGFVSAITQPECVRALTLTIGCAILATAVNAVMGTMIAWLLVRDDFRGKRIIEAVIDVPFALPTIVAGVTLMTLLGPHSPIHLSLANTWGGIVVALLFVTLPFTVRTVEPVLESMSTAPEMAATTLGASSWRTFRTITLPSLTPAILTGAGLSFARAVGEFGSVVFISGNRPFHTEVASSYIFMLSQSQNFTGAAAVSVLLLVIAIAVLTLFAVLSRRLTSRLGNS
ncbi:MAG: sulfate ABC transporter permease subunit CysT, partial [Actinobacteria bacterium]|nr:sulfate ABC transporter permease subunit CysT [Actinomycetota bacterium]